VDRSCGYADDYLTRRDIPRDDRVRADHRACADMHTGQNGDTPAYPCAPPYMDWLCIMATIADRLAFGDLVVGIADARVFTDHNAILKHHRGM